MSERPDWFHLIAVERGLPPEWRWYHSEWKGEGGHAFVLVKGAIPGAVFTRGPRKGKPNPAKYTNESELAITRADMDSIKAKWSAQTGLCHECCGEGQVVYGWSKEDGTRSRSCKPCGATGKRGTP